MHLNAANVKISAKNITTSVQKNSYAEIDNSANVWYRWDVVSGDICNNVYAQLHM